MTAKIVTIFIYCSDFFSGFTELVLRRLCDRIASMEVEAGLCDSKYIKMKSKFRCLNDAYNGTGRCTDQCDTCQRVAGVLHTNNPPLNKDVLILLNLGQIRVGQWNGTSWHIHADGLEQFLLNVSAWMPLPEIKDFYAVSA